MNDDTHSGFNLPDLDLSDEWMDDDLASAVSGMNQSYGYQTSDGAAFFSGSSGSFSHLESPSTNAYVASASAENQVKKETKKVKERVAFKTQSDGQEQPKSQKLLQMFINFSVFPMACQGK